MRSCFTTAVRAALRAAFFVSALFLPVTVPTAPADARTVCAARDEIVSVLDSRYGERPAAVGMAGERVVVEVFATPDGTTWTIVLTRADGVSCIVLAGEAWRPVPRSVGDRI